MKLKIFFHLFTFLFLTFFLTNYYAQTGVTKSLIMNSNNVTFQVYNYGSFNKPNHLTNVADFVWDGLGYMGEFGPLVAAEVTDTSGNIIHITSDSFILPSQGDYSPDSTLKWGWLPVPGFSNENSTEVANSLNSSSWPDNWLKWPGEYGEGKIIALNEAYYKMSDFSNAEFNYYPFPSDSSKRGLGLSAEVRVYQFGGNMKDAVIVKYFLTNESSKALDKVYFGFQGNPHIGGVNDFGDDKVGLAGYTSIIPQKYIKSTGTIYLWDKDFKGMDGKIPGYLGFKFLETPDNKSLTSFHSLTYTNSDPNVPKNDPLMWQLLSGGIDTANLDSFVGDISVNFGTGPFSLAPSETKVIKLAIIFSHDYSDLINDAAYIDVHYNWVNLKDSIASNGGNENYHIQLNSNFSTPVSGSYEIGWNYSGSDDSARVLVEYSDNLGANWFPLILDNDVKGKYSWHTTETHDGKNYILRLIAYDPNNPQNYYFTVSDSRFTIDNPSENAKPELNFNLPFAGTELHNPFVPIQWSCEDADNDSLEVTLEYKIQENGNFNQIMKGKYPNGSFTYDWDISNLPNANSYFIKVSVSDGNSDTSLTSESFGVNISKTQLIGTQIRHIHGNASADVKVVVSDLSMLKNDEYKLTFNLSKNKKYLNINDITLNKDIINNYTLYKNVSTPQFDGLKVTVIDKEAGIDSLHTKFNNSSLNNYFKIYFDSQGSYPGDPKVPDDEDWIVVFNDLDTLSDGSYSNPGDTARSVHAYPAFNVICPFYIINLDSAKTANYLVVDDNNNSKWDINEQIVLQPQDLQNPFETSYALNFIFDGNNLPHNGDTLFIKTYKQIDSSDEYRFSPDSNFVVTVNDQKISNKFYLSQNFPNPFNPSTVIKYTIPYSEFVTLKVYDILGREVVTLANKEQLAGSYKVIFNGTNLSSGVYLYRLKAGKNVITKKLLLLK